MDYTLEGKKLVCSACLHVMARTPRSIMRYGKSGTYSKCSKCGAEHSSVWLVVGNTLIANLRDTQDADTGDD